MWWSARRGNILGRICLLIYKIKSLSFNNYLHQLGDLKFKCFQSDQYWVVYYLSISNHYANLIIIIVRQTLLIHLKSPIYNIIAWHKTSKCILIELATFILCFIAIEHNIICFYEYLFIQLAVSDTTPNFPNILMILSQGKYVWRQPRISALFIHSIFVPNIP